MNWSRTGGSRMMAVGLRLCVLLLAGSTLLTAQDIKVTLLGTGNPRPAPERFGPSTLIEAGGKKLLFDCGRGATIRLYQAQVSFADIDSLFLTHLHSDHVVGIPDFWLTGWIMGRGVPLHIWGPRGTRHMISHLEKAYAYDVHMRRDVDEKLPAQGAAIVVKEISEGVVFDQDGVRVTAFPVDHGPVKPAFGYRVDFAGHSVVLSGDTRFNENLVRFARGTDVLIHEVLDLESYRAADRIFTEKQMQRVIGHHTTAEDAGRVFSQVKPRLAVYSHIVPPNAPDLVAHTRKTYSGPLQVGEDLMTVDIGKQVEVHHGLQ